MQPKKIVIVSAEQDTVLQSLTAAKKRLEDAREKASNANEEMFEKILNLDPDDEEASVEKRIARAEEIQEAELAAEKAWAKYDRALLRYGWECAQARKAGILD
jgi:hypothetical protein